MTTPYYVDEAVTLYHADCREISEWWLGANVLVTDPPYGIGWREGRFAGAGNPTTGHQGIRNDQDTSVRDAALLCWGGSKPALVFGSLRADYPAGWTQMLVFGKPSVAAGIFGQRGPWLANWEPVFVLGDWPDQTPIRTAVITTRAPAAAGYSGYVTRYGHPHAKPVDVMETLIEACPPGVIADPFAGSGSTLEAARRQGRKAIGVEIDERYCELIARRMSQGILMEVTGD